MTEKEKLWLDSGCGGYEYLKKYGGWQELREPYNPPNGDLQEWMANKEKEIGCPVHVLDINHYHFYMDGTPSIKYEIFRKGELS